MQNQPSKTRIIISLIIWGIICALGISLCTSNTSRDDSKTPKSPPTVPIYVSKPPPECDSNSVITGFTYYTRKYAHVYIKKSPKSIRAKTKEDLVIGDLVTVFEECTQGDWSWIRLLDHECLKTLDKNLPISTCSYTSKFNGGWVHSTELLKERDGVSSESLKRSETPEERAKFPTRLSHLGLLRRKAAEFGEGICFYPSGAHLDLVKSSEHDLRFYLFCNDVRHDFNEFELRRHE